MNQLHSRLVTQVGTSLYNEFNSDYLSSNMGEVFDGRIEMEEEKIQVTPEQEVIMEEFSTLVRKILTQAEASFADRVQRESFKRIVENQVYEARNNILKRMAVSTTVTPATPRAERILGSIVVEGTKQVEAIGTTLPNEPQVEPEVPAVLKKDITRRVTPLRM